MAVLLAVVKVLLALGVVAFVSYPLLRATWGGGVEADVPEEIEDLYRRKETTYSALKELEFDYRTGKLSDSDYQELEAKYKHEALEVLEAIERAERGTGGSGAGERHRAGGAVAAAPGVCPSCERQNSAEARFCATCGEPLTGALISTEPAEPAAEDDGCPECGEDVSSNAKFCGGCGTQLAG